MILAAHQPAYLPDITFLAKMLYCDVLVLTDDFQFSTHAQINRCRIKTAQGILWLTIPVLTSGKGRQLNTDVEIDPQQNWRHKHLKSIQVNYGYAAYYEPVSEILTEIHNHKWDFLYELNIKLIRSLHTFLNLNTKIVYSSDIGCMDHGLEKITTMMDFHNCTTYLADNRYKGYLKRHWPKKTDYKMITGRYIPVPYFQQFGEFTGNLSMIDLVFNEGGRSLEIARQSFEIQTEEV